MNPSHILVAQPSPDYELLDSGEGEKLERFGKIVLSRPDPQALWSKKLPPEEWKKADGVFDTSAITKNERGDWKLKPTVPNRWEISFADLKLYIKPTAFKHVGVFPEQAPNWDWMREKIQEAAGVAPFSRPAELATLPLRSDKLRSFESSTSVASADIEILNLFAYTGGASLACAQAGAKVVHVDGSKVALTWARENAELSGLKDKPVRWILDDARAFVKREIKRGRKYHGIIMDPPAFGHGPENEVWKIEDDFHKLVEDCISLLADKPLFFLINGYSAGYSAVAYRNNLLPLVEKFGGKIEIGELTLQERIREVANGGIKGEVRLLPCGIFVRWSA